MTKIRIALIITCALLAAASYSCDWRTGQPATTGGANANTNVNTLAGWQLSDGKRARGSDFNGKVVLIDFYATWCEPCRHETPDLVALHQKYASQGLQIIGLNVGGEDDYGQVPEYKKDFGIEYPLGIPDDDLVEQLLGDNGNIPQTFVFNRRGQLIRHLVGYSEARAPEIEQLIASELQSPQ
jgi:thiol-disulfide isomerase/thioredoxin